MAIVQMKNEEWRMKNEEWGEKLKGNRLSEKDGIWEGDFSSFSSNKNVRLN